jgi:excisionase family DNA binding protein
MLPPLPQATSTLLTVNQVASKLNVSSATIWRWVRQGAFPAPVKLSRGTTRWRSSDIADFEATLTAGLMICSADHPHLFLDWAA